MTVLVTLTDGRKVQLAENMGATVEEVTRNLAARTLTGSLSTLDDVDLDLADGGFVRYGDATVWEDVSAF